MQYLNQLRCSRTTLLLHSLHYSTISVIMASESRRSIIDWLLDVEVEAFAHWEQTSLPDPSFSDATFSPTIHAPSSFSSLSSPSSPGFVGLKHSRKRKHHRDRLDFCPKDPYHPREPLKEIMSSPNKRARTNLGPLERAAQAEVRPIDHDTASSSCSP